MKKHLSRIVHIACIIISFPLLLLTTRCANYTFFKTFDGPDRPAARVAKLFLDKGFWTRPDRDRPISFVVDGKLYEPYSLDKRTPCLLLLPGEHEVIIRPLPQLRTKESGEAKTGVLYKVFPTPAQHLFKLTVAEGGEYLVAEDYPDSWEWNYMIFWIEDRISKKRITEEIRFEWK
jgi:hypothetical protein